MPHIVKLKPVLKRLIFNGILIYFNSMQELPACTCTPGYDDDDMRVFVFQNEAGRLQLEGCLCDIYYRVRELLYEQYAIV